MSTSTPYWDSAGLNLSNTNSFRAGSFGANNYITVGRPTGYSSSVTTGGGLDVSGVASLNSVLSFANNTGLSTPSVGINGGSGDRLIL